MRKHARIPGMKAKRSFHVPRCSVHGTPTQKNDSGVWVCLTCADEWLEREVQRLTHGRSQGGVELPAGVADERIEAPSFRGLVPNRAQRRAMGVR